MLTSTPCLSRWTETGFIKSDSTFYRWLGNEPGYPTRPDVNPVFLKYGATRSIAGIAIGRILATKINKYDDNAESPCLNLSENQGIFREISQDTAHYPFGFFRQILAALILQVSLLFRKHFINN